jgi:hypothetical protein
MLPDGMARPSQDHLYPSAQLLEFAAQAEIIPSLFS